MSHFTPLRGFDSAERASRDQREEARAQCLSRFRSVFIAALFLGLFAMFVIFMRVPTPEDSYGSENDSGADSGTDSGSATDFSILSGSVFLVQLDSKVHLALWSQQNVVDSSFTIQSLLFTNTTTAPSSDQIHELYSSSGFFTVLDYVYLPEATPPTLYLVGLRSMETDLVVLSSSVNVSNSVYTFGPFSETNGVLPYLINAFIVPIDKKTAYIVSTAESCSGTAKLHVRELPLNGTRWLSLDADQTLENSSNVLQYAGLLRDPVSGELRVGAYFGKFVTDTQCSADEAKKEYLATDLSPHYSFNALPCQGYRGYRFAIVLFTGREITPPLWNDSFSVHYTWNEKTLLRSPACLCQWWDPVKQSYSDVTEPWAAQLCLDGRIKSEQTILKVLRQKKDGETDPYTIETVVPPTGVALRLKDYDFIMSEDNTIHLFAKNDRILYSVSGGQYQTYQSN